MDNAVRKLIICFFVTVASLFYVTSAYSVEERSVTMVSVITGDEFIGLFKEPSAVFYDDSKSRLYVADSGNGRLISFDPEFEYLSELVDDNMILPVGVVKSSEGGFYVVDASTRKVLSIDVANKSIEALKFEGIPKDSEGFVPGSIAIGPNDMLYLTDRMNRRILVFDGQGAYIRSVTVKDEGLRGFDDLRLDSRGYLYAVDSVGANVYIFSEKGLLLSSFGGRDKGLELSFPVSVAIDSDRRIYILDRHRGAVLVFNEKGILQHTLMKKGNVEGRLYSPSYIFIDSKDTLYVVDGSRVQIFKEE